MASLAAVIKQEEKGDCNVTNLETTLARHDEQLEHSACRLKRIEEKLDRLHTWLVGLLGGMVVSLVLLVINLGTRHPL